MNDPIEAFCAFHHEYNNITEPRRKMQTRVLRAFEAYLPGDIVDVNADQLQAYLTHLVAEGFHVNTVRQYLNAIRPLLTWMWERKLIDGDTLMELRAIKPPRGASGNGRPRPYDRQELDRFWHELEEAYPRGQRVDFYVKRWRNGSSRWNRVQTHARRLQIEAIIALALYGALRRDEIFNLRLEELHPDNEYIVVRSRKNPDGEERVRVVPWLSEDMRNAVRRWLEFRELIAPPHDRPWLSLHYREHHMKPMRHRRYEMLLRNIGRGWEFHRMRHTGATMMVRSGMRIERVQKILGHSRIEQTLQYVKIDHTDVVRAARQVESIYSRAFARPDQEAA